MSEQQDKPKILVTDPKVLHKIKYIQLRRQLIPIIIVVLLLIVNIFSPQKYLFYPSLIAFGWYLLERIMYRTKNKIHIPDEGAFVSPVNGKIQHVKKGAEATLVTLRKSWLDVVELRLPYTDLRMESNRNWFFETPIGQVNLKIQSEKITYFENKNITGAVIGVLPGSSIITLHAPAGIRVLVKDGDLVFGGETELFGLTEALEAPKSILVEEPMDEIEPNEGV